jgi:PAS domain S-box-containing protein
MKSTGSNNNEVRILIAEDSPTQAEKLRYILEKVDFNVFLAVNGQEAYEMAIELNPSLIISDILMPKLDGYELCSKLKSNIKTCHIPVILLTSLSGTVELIKGLNSGASNFITKPFTEAYILMHIHQILQSKSSCTSESDVVQVEMLFDGEKKTISANPQQMLNLLFSSYEAAIQRNMELTHAKDELKNINDQLEDIVDERTRNLTIEITKNIQTQEELKKSFSMLEATLESTIDGILVVDLDGRIVKMNNKFKEQWNISEEVLRTGKDEDALNAVLNQVKHPVEYLSRVKEIYENNRSESFDFVEFIDGRIYERHSKPQLLDDNVIGRVWSFVDVTEQKKSALQLRLKNEELQKTNAEKDKLFSIIAHDLRSPFNGFIGLTSVMMEEALEITPEEVLNFSRRLNVSANNIFELLNNLLEWSTINKGTIVPKPENIDVQTLINNNIDIVNERATQKGISIVNHIPLNQFVYADKKMFNTVIRNLLSNAVKFTKKGGTITIDSEVLNNHILQIAVSDSGIGIPLENLDKLFKSSECIGTKGTDGEPSTGLGLILCKEFIELNRGQLTVSSEQNVGSTFKFTLPILNEPTHNQEDNLTEFESSEIIEHP